MSIDSNRTEDRKASDYITASLNRRAHRRLRCKGIAQIYILPGGAKLDASVVDVSPAGCCIEIHNNVDIQTGDQVEVTLRVNGNEVQLAGVLCNVRNHSLAGINFSNVSERKQIQLKNLIIGLFEIDGPWPGFLRGRV